MCNHPDLFERRDVKSPTSLSFLPSLLPPSPLPHSFLPFLFGSAQLWKYRYFSAGLLLPHDPYPDHLKKLEEQISSGDAERKVLREVLADEVKVRRRSSLAPG